MNSLRVLWFAVLSLSAPVAATAAIAETAPPAKTALPDAPSAVVGATAPTPVVFRLDPTVIQQSAATQQASDSSSSSSVKKAAQSPDTQSQHEQAERDIKAQEKQRVLGVLPQFNTTDNQNAPPLSAGQKYDLAFHSAIDPAAFGIAAIDAGISQAEDDFPGYGQGAQGYFKRFGASYADSFDGTIIGNAVLPALLHQDPRYFRLGHGKFSHRLWYSITTTVRCKGDDGHWQFNTSNVAGNFIAGGISNIYYPASDRGFGLTISRASTVTAEGTLGALFLEFWPDIHDHVFHRKDPNYKLTPMSAPGTPPPSND